MAQSADQTPGDGEKIESTQDGDKSLPKNLPVVLAPKLGAGEDDAFDETPAEPVGDAAPKMESPASTRFLMLAATVAFAAAFGSFVGSVSGSGLAHFVYAPAPSAPP